MAINVTSRIRNAMVGLALLLSAVFTAVIFLLIFIIEDRVFINQVKFAQAEFSHVVTNGSPAEISNWQPSGATMVRIYSVNDLPSSVPESVRARVDEQPGVHEYFDENNALFIARLNGVNNKASAGFLVYDVADLLAVRGTKVSLFLLIGCVSLIITVIAILFARRLTKSTLAPIVKLTTALKQNDLDDVIINMANEFSKDEISVLTQELALALEGQRRAAQREFEFNRGVSHELRSPIQVAQSAVELLQEVSQNATDNTAKPIARLQRSVNEMNGIANAFLWLSSSRSLQKNEWCTVAQLKSPIDNLKAMTSNPLTLKLALPTADHQYPIPSTALTVIIRNLVRNAVQHGNEEEVVIHLTQQGVSVTNRLNQESGESPSFGVGLSIVEALCERFDCELKREQGQDAYSASVLMPRK